MTTRLPSRWRFLSLTVIGALLWSLSIAVSAQSNGLNTGFTLDFVKPDGVASVDDVVTNVVKAVNRTSRPIRFNLDIAAPAEWRMVNSRPEKLYTVRPGDSTFIPVRLIPAKSSVGNVNYFISATAYSEFGNALASTPWSVSVQKISKWKFLVEERQVYFTNSSDSSAIHMRLKNEGNSVEKLRVRFYADKRLQLTDSEGELIRENVMLFQLPSGTDTAVVVNVKVKDNIGKGYFFTDAPDDNEDKEVAKKYRLQIQASSTDEKNKAKGRRVDFVKLTSIGKLGSNYGGAYIPITAELRSFNVLSEFTNFTLDLRGVTDLGRRRFLQYNYQTIITTGIAGTQVQGANRFLQYSSPTLTLAAGNIGENMGVFISGFGAKGSVKVNKFEVGGLYATNANRGGILSPNDLTYYAGRVRYDAKEGSDIELQYINQYDNFSSVDGNIFRMQANVKVNRRHRVRLVGGYSLQEDQFNPDSVYTVSGYGGELRYAGGIGKFNYSVNGSYYSDLFLAQRSGIQQGSASVRYGLKGNKSLSMRGAVTTNKRTIIRRGMRFVNPVNRRDYFELRYQWRRNGATMQFSPNYRFDQLLGLKVETTGASLGFSKSGGKTFRLYSRFFAGMSNAIEADINPFPVARWENRVRYKNLNVMVRYNYGPATLMENFRVIEDRLTPQSLFVSANASLYFRKQRFQIQPRLNLRYESIFARWRSNFSSDFIYYANSGYQFTVGVELLNIRQGESPLALRSQQQGFDGLLQEFTQTNQFLRFGIKKQFKIRRPGGKSFDLKVVVFKDADGNGIRDTGEELVENVLLKVNDKAVITNTQGQAEFKNMVFGNYMVQSDVLGDSEGWFKTDDNSIVMDRSKTLFIPLSRGVQISGNILLQKATYSRFVNEVDLSGIRVSAIGKDNKVYSGLTNRDGQFRIFVPFGQYQVTASSATLDEQFQFAQDSYQLEIDNAEADFQVTYYLIEKSRRLKIKKFN